MKTFIKMNVAIAGFEAGQKWPRDKAPDVVKMWVKLPGVLGEKLICSVVDEKGKVISSKLKAESSKKEKKTTKDPKDDRTKTCKGVKADGTPCGQRRLIAGTDYCQWHQKQAPSQGG